QVDDVEVAGADGGNGTARRPGDAVGPVDANDVGTNKAAGSEFPQAHGVVAGNGQGHAAVGREGDGAKGAVAGAEQFLPEIAGGQVPDVHAGAGGDRLFAVRRDRQGTITGTLDRFPLGYELRIELDL